MILWVFLFALTIFLQAVTTADGAAGLGDGVAEHGIAGIVGIVLPIIVAFVRRPGTPVALSIGIALGASVITAAIGLVVAGKLTLDGIEDPGYILTGAALAFTEATIIYQTWFRETDANRKLQEFPPKTSSPTPIEAPPVEIPPEPPVP